MERGLLRGGEVELEGQAAVEVGCFRFGGREGRGESVGAVLAGHRPRRLRERLGSFGVRPDDREVEAGGFAAVVDGRMVDLRADLGALGVMERVGRLVGQREVRRPRHREAATLGAEDDVLEAPSATVVVAEVSRCSTTTR